MVSGSEVPLSVKWQPHFGTLGLGFGVEGLGLNPKTLKPFFLIYELIFDCNAVTSLAALPFATA